MKDNFYSDASEDDSQFSLIDGYSAQKESRVFLEFTCNQNALSNQVLSILEEMVGNDACAELIFEWNHLLKKGLTIKQIAEQKHMEENAFRKELGLCFEKVRSLLQIS